MGVWGGEAEDTAGGEADVVRLPAEVVLLVVTHPQSGQCDRISYFSCCADHRILPVILAWFLIPLTVSGAVRVAWLQRQ